MREKISQKQYQKKKKTEKTKHKYNLSVILTRQKVKKEKNKGPKLNIINIKNTLKKKVRKTKLYNALLFTV